MGFGHDSSKELAEDLKNSLSALITIPKIQLKQTDIVETSDREKSRNILEKSYYLHIKCTAVNSLTKLMWR